MITRSPFCPRFRPRSASISTTFCAWRTVRTKGTMSSMLTSPMSLRTLLSASHSIAKASANSGLT